MQIINSSATYLIASVAFDNAFLAVNSGSNITLSQAGVTVPGIGLPLRWQFSMGLSTTRWNICTNQSNGLFCLDEWGNIPQQPALQRAGAYSGQQWILTAITGTNSDQSQWRLQNDYTGLGRYLSTTGVGFNSMTVGDNNSTIGSQQSNLWIFVAVDTDSTNIPAIDPSSRVLSGQLTTSTVFPSPTTTMTTLRSTSNSVTSTTATSGTTSTISPTATPQPETPGSSTAVKAGIGVGVGVGVLAIAAIVAWVLWLRKKKQRADPDGQSQNSPPAYHVYNPSATAQSTAPTEILTETKTPRAYEMSASESRHEMDTTSASRS